MSVSIKVTNTTQVATKLRQKEKVVIRACLSAVHITAEAVFNDSQSRIHRVTGALADSGKIVYENTDTSAIAIIGYGDSSTNPKTGFTTASYAVKAHEAFGGKWLENAMIDNTELFKNSLLEKVGQALNS